MIIIPKYKDTEVELAVPTSTLSGKFKLKVIRPDGSTRLETDWFKNVILNTGLDYRMGGNGYSGYTMRYCYVGTGNSTPVATQTGLDNLVMTSGEGTVNYSAQQSAPYYGYGTGSYQFSAAASNYNLTEIGIGHSSTELTSRALILDGLGNPTTIAIQTGEILQAAYQLNVYPPLSDTVQTVTISGTPYTVTTRALEVTASNPWGSAAGTVFNWTYSQQTYTSTATLAAITASAPATCSYISSPTSLTYSSYTNGTYSRTATAYYDVNTSNSAGGIGAFTSTVGGVGRFQYVFSTPIPKTSSNSLTLTFNYSVAAV